MANVPFRWDATVRNYELDNQGIVNNATYLNYLEECRNHYVQHIQLDLAAFAKAGYHFVVSNIAINYRQSLMHNQAFYVTVTLKTVTDKRFIFSQSLFDAKSGHLIADAEVTIACIELATRKSCMPETLQNFLGHLLEQ